ncbi:beta-ketoacyl synthase chain length factor [Sphingobacterium multivorum]|uniref:Beta-ketoacyl synthase chain length factor n=1 Tax=Sphingobacterium multivorum TaxID=28454 RepID=A0ABX7CHV8_SPHMU|nr:beta-ketoacyl synthase chain length factor [Sphingobacterium multivorum]QQT51596.1 beta-ketoacyl synthase chain length factor [Sphingobacterium multivorum]
MHKVYINAASICVNNLSLPNSRENWIKVDLPKIDSKILSPNSARRMSKAVKMGIICAMEALQQIDRSELDGILVGSGKGCLIDSDKFLQSIVVQQEEFLSPTAFIQSTHNTVAGQIALLIKNTGYNMTYSQGRVSFESTVFDAYLQLVLNERKTLLVGAVDELSDISIDISESIANTTDQPITTGIPRTEGAGFFIFSNQKNQHTLGELVDMVIYHPTEELRPESQLAAFLKKNKLSAEQLDLVIYGSAKPEPPSEMEAEAFNDLAKINYQSQIGYFDTDVVFAFDFALKQLNNQTFRSMESPTENKISAFQHVLICNFGDQNSLMLLSRC